MASDMDFGQGEPATRRKNCSAVTAIQLRTDDRSDSTGAF